MPPLWVKDIGARRHCGKVRLQIRGRVHWLPLQGSWLGTLVMPERHLQQPRGGSITSDWRVRLRRGARLCLSMRRRQVVAAYLLWRSQPGFSALFLRKSIHGVSGSLLELYSFPILIRPTLNGKLLFPLPSLVQSDCILNSLSCLRVILQVSERQSA